MASLIDCECCGKKISEESMTCISCGHPIKTLLFSYEYNGEILNSPLFRDEIYKLDILKKVMKVELYDIQYEIVDITCNAHNEVVHVILGDI